ncbi:MAG: ATP-binding protein [Pseudolactococcus laudensis]|uniref:ATP-binding protein n=1 Tax=Pseudolactococcus laudensis TaxID=1494461 RepID=UPI003F9D3C97
MIRRETYLSDLERLKDKRFIKVLTGVRRSGKSTLLALFQEQLITDQVSQTQIQSYNFEDLALADYLDYRKLYEKITDNLLADQMNYIFLDEIQMVPEFERVLDSLFIKENVDLYVTGSNAYMLSGELATLLSGRYVELKVYPLSFVEFFSALGGDKATVFQRYLEFGGFPYVTEIPDELTYRDYISGIVNTVLIKDVLQRKQRSDATLVEQLAKYLTDSSGSLVTIKKIADTLTSMGQKTTSDTVSTYLSGFQEAYLFFRADRYDIAGKKYLSINSKYYPVDQSLRKVLLGNKRPNFGHRLEGVVYLELLRRGYQVFIGNIGEFEIDFVAQKNGVTEYYQVSLTVEDDRTYQREVRPFQSIQDNYRKILLTMDNGRYNQEGIEQLNIIDWLLAR